MSAPAPSDAAERTRRDRSHALALIALVAGAACMADLIAKRAAESALADGSLVSLPLIDLRLVYNPGVAFGMGAGLLPSWAVVLVTGAIIVIGTVLLVRASQRLNLVSLVGGAVLLGGALGNLVDRLDGGGVVDYFHTGWFATFNLADVFVTTGVALLVVGVWWSGRGSQKARALAV